ncbi:O-glucosyltransferase rumi homolog [Rhodnius prolixus]|uniref:Putative endoplasmic reticulum protein ep58 n=1 Tax=Rhodnius prolixus TaxID=13249 RepID=R4G7R7_RHOPR
MLLYFVLFLLNINTLESHSHVCNSANCKQSHNLYEKGSNYFLTQYYKAQALYKNDTCDKCSCYLNVIEADLRPFKNGITEEMLRICSSKGVKYQLIEGKWYRNKECLFPSRCEGVEYFLTKLNHELPDLELCVNFHDWSQISKHHSSPLPMFSFSKPDNYYDIMYPAWSFWKGGPAIKLIPQGLGRWDLGRQSISKAADRSPWEKKIEKAFFRGSRTSSERDNIVLLSRANPSIADAAYTKNQAWKSVNDTLGEQPSNEISLEDHCQYKYLLNFRGVAASFRFKYLFLCKSLVIHVGNEWKEFFYTALKPWVHYVPLDKYATTTDYKKLLSFLNQEDSIAKSIALRGYRFVYNYLKMEDIFCYWRRLLLQYSKLLTFKPKFNKELILVKKIS